MQFKPPRCPYRSCVQHAFPGARFYARHGSYRPRCRRVPVPRFRCRTCHRTFSRQTFRHDYRDRRPECNVPLFAMLVSGTGLRQASRILRIDVHAVQRKFRKIALTCRRLHRNLSAQLPAHGTYVLDEEETFEKASIRPLTMAALIERDSYLVVSTAVGPIRRLSARGTQRRREQDHHESRGGRRRDRSRRCVRAVMRALRARATGQLTLLSDEKASYGQLGREVFGDDVRHERTISTLARGTFNPLFPINLTLAMTRDNCGRLHRRSWLVTEKRRCLQFQMHLFTAYRNYVRRRHNHDQPHATPAFLLGLAPRALAVREVLRWRQDWGAASIHPISRSAARAVA